MRRTWKQIIALIFYYLLIFMGAYCFFLQIENQTGNADMLKNIFGAILLTILISIIKKHADNETDD